MKKNSNILVFVFLFIHSLIQNSFAMNFTVNTSRKGIWWLPPPRGLYWSCYMENYILYFIYPVITLLWLYFIFIAPYRFYRKYKKMSQEEKNKMILPIMIKNLINSWLIWLLLIWVLIITYLLKSDNYFDKNVFWIPERLIVFFLYLCFIISALSFLFEIIYWFLHRKKDFEVGKKIMKESIIRYAITTAILLWIFWSIEPLINYLWN